MKKFLALLFIFVLFFTGCGKKEKTTAFDEILKKDVLVVGVKTNSVPFGYISKKTGRNAGFDVDVAKNIAKDILGSEKKIKFVPVESDSRIEKLMEGEVDIVVATMSAIPQREYLIDFSIPYFIAGQTALVRDGSNINTITDLRRKTTIVVVGSTSERNLRRIIPTSSLIGYKDYASAFEAFVNGKGDAISSDDAILLGLLKQHPEYRMLKNRISKEFYCVGIRKEDDNDKLKRNVNMSITRMNKDGTLNLLKRKWGLSG